jgi:formamidopyrimidine-DNA glycosylase
LIPILLVANLGAMQARAQFWEHSKRHDQLEGKTYYQFVLRGKYLVPPSHPISAPPQLVVFCEAGRFARGQFLPGAVAQPWGTRVLTEAHRSHVNIQVDDGRTNQALWDYRNDGMALGFDQMQLKKLLGHPPQDPIAKRVTLGISEALGKEVVVQFDMPQNPTTLVQTCGLE